MAWTLPLSAASWTAHPWQQLAVLNECITATNMRLLTVDEADYVVTSALTTRTTGDDIQSTIETFRDDSFKVAVGSNNISDGGWVNRDVLVLGSALDIAGNEYIDGTGWTQLFIDEVNAKLTGWSLPTMGASPISGQIPWTRKYGDRTAWTTGTGRIQAGDWIGGHIFNEWRACLDVLDCIITTNYTIDDGDSDDFRQHSGSAAEEASCADAKTAVETAWVATTPPIGAPGVSAYGSITYGWDADGTVNWQPYEVTQPEITNGTCRIYAQADEVAGGYVYDDFGYGWTQDVVGQIESVTADGTPFVFEIAPFPDGTFVPTTDVSCPAEGEIERAGFQVEVLGLVVDLTYPAP